MPLHWLLQGDCLTELAELPSESVDVVCTDPPYGLSFMGSAWDHGVPGAAYWREILRVAKPGAWLTAFGGTRTYHRLAVAIEDGGWQIRDCIMWLYGTGFPKSHDVSKALDKAGAAALAHTFDGYGTALKPAYEPIVLARKPMPSTVADNVARHGTGGLNIAASRVPTDGRPLRERAEHNIAGVATGTKKGSRAVGTTPEGRWPPNVLLLHGPDCTEADCAEGCPVAELDGQSGITVSSGGEPHTGELNRHGIYGHRHRERTGRGVGKGDTGTAARFFPRFRYAPKASRKERGPDNRHPTVKPVAVVQWLLRLTAPPAELEPVVLDPFMGSGTTGLAAEALGLDFVGVELDADHCALAERRITAARVDQGDE